jgi:hypothetical protein
MAQEVGELHGTRIFISCPFWRLEFNRHRGGALDAIVFPHGSGRNILVAPFRTYVDGWADVYESQPQVSGRIDHGGALVLLDVAGELCDAGGNRSGIQYHHHWRITERAVRVDTTLHFIKEVAVRTVGIGSVALVPRLNEFGVRHGPWDDWDPEVRCPARYGHVAINAQPSVDEHHTPLWLLVAQRHMEGIDFMPASDLHAWEERLTGRRGVGRYRLTGLPYPDRIELLREPLASPYPLPVHHGAYRFGWYLGLPRLAARSDRRWFQVAVPDVANVSDESITRWAEAGVNLVRVPVQPAGRVPDVPMPDDDALNQAGVDVRVLAERCRACGVTLIPEFSVMPRTPDPGTPHAVPVQLVRSVGREAPAHGAQELCPAADWLESLKVAVQHVVEQYGSGGLAFTDASVLPCCNRGHDAAMHTGIDNLVHVLEWARALVGAEGIVVLHQEEAAPSIVLQNFADLIVHVEDSSPQRGVLRRAEDLPLMSALGEGILHMPAPPAAADDPELRIRHLIVQLAVMGMVPWTDGSRSAANLDETLRYFRRLSRFPLHEYECAHAFQGVVSGGHPELKGAIYFRDGHGVLVLANTSLGERLSASWRIDLARLGWDQKQWYRIVNPESGAELQQHGDELVAGGLIVALDPLEYVVLEIAPLLGARSDLMDPLQVPRVSPVV